MPLGKEYMEGRATERPTRSFPTSPLPQNPLLGYRQWLAPLAASLNAFVTTVAGPNTATNTYVRSGSGVYKIASGGTISGITFPGATPSGVMDCPRNVVVTVTHASAVVALSGIIYGIDEFHRHISEAWSVTAGTTSKTFTGAKAFYRVDGITVVAVADASADSVTVGTGNVLGLPFRNAVAGTNAAVKETIDAGIVVTGVYTAASTSAAADSQGTFLPATVPNAAHNYESWFLVNDLQV